MATLTFSIMDMTLQNMTDEQRRAEMDRQYEEQKQRAIGLQRAPAQQLNPFPKWFKQLIRDLPNRYPGTKVRFDENNKIYIFTFSGDADEAEDIQTEFKERFDALLKDEKFAEREEALAWMQNHVPKWNVKFEDEGMAMRELEEYLSSRAPSRPSKKKRAATTEE